MGAHMTVLGIDSAELTGFALVSKGPGASERLLRHGTMHIRTAADVEAAVAEFAPHAPDVVAVEAPFVRANAATGLTLAVLLGRWLQEWERRGATAVTVLASTWQIALLTGLIDGRSKRDQRKRAARTWAQAAFGEDLSEDEADAACIASWALRQGRGLE